MSTSVNVLMAILASIVRYNVRFTIKQYTLCIQTRIHTISSLIVFYQVSNEEYTDCGPTLLTDAEAVLTSPLYPTQYPPNTRCQWHIQAVEGHTISFRLMGKGY